MNGRCREHAQQSVITDEAPCCYQREIPSTKLKAKPGLFHLALLLSWYREYTGVNLSYGMDFDVSGVTGRSHELLA